MSGMNTTWRLWVYVPICADRSLGELPGSNVPSVGGILSMRFMDKSLELSYFNAANSKILVSEIVVHKC
jgi:hypothetical protein